MCAARKYRTNNIFTTRDLPFLKDAEIGLKTVGFRVVFVELNRKLQREVLLSYRLQRIYFNPYCARYGVVFCGF